MPLRCAICTHPQRRAIDSLIGLGIHSTKSIAREFAVSYDSMKRHVRNDHVEASPSLSVASAASPKAVRAVPTTPIETFELAFGKRPTAWQKEYLAETADLVLLKGRQIGATQAAAALAVHTAMTEKGIDVVIISPSQAQSKEITRRARLGLWELDVSMPQDSESVLRLDTGSRIVSLPGNARAVRGYSPRLVIIDEAAWVADETWEAAEPLVIASGGRVIVQSTCGMPSGFFHALATQPRDGWAAMTVPSTDVPTVDQKRLEKQREDMDPITFAQEYLAQFPSAEQLSAAVFHPDDIARAFEAGKSIKPLQLRGEA